MQEAHACALGISDEYEKCRALRDLSAKLAEQGHAKQAEAIGTEIPQIAMRHSCWKANAIAALKKDSWKVALNALQDYKSDEARLFYLKGWSENVVIKDVTVECLASALTLVSTDSESIEALLQKYALQETLLDRTKPALQQRLNRSLNTQWAIDIAEQFSKEETNARLSTNLDTWLHEITDEDDRDDIKSWAEKVKNRKMTEEKFNEKVKSMI